MNLLDISEVSARSGVAASAIRHYEEKGLIGSVGRKGLKRLFEPVVLDQLALINLGKAAGFALDDIKGMFGPDGQPALERSVLLKKAEHLHQQIKRLTALREMIIHVAKCPAPSHMECRRFQKLLRIASKQAGEKAKFARTVQKTSDST